MERQVQDEAPPCAERGGFVVSEGYGVSMRVLVTGSRDWTDQDAVFAALDAVCAEFDVLPQSVVVVHGAARGADTLAAQWGEERNAILEPYPAQWDRYGRSAGPRRNTQMVGQGADLCLAFPLPGSVGTFDCMSKAEAAGIPVRVVAS